MGFRFRRSVRIAPGFRLNLSKSGTSISVGGRGATLNVGKKGIKATYGIAGTGISYQTKRAPFHPEGSKTAHIKRDLPSSRPRVDRLPRSSKVMLWTFGGVTAAMLIILTNAQNAVSTTSAGGRPAIVESTNTSTQSLESGAAFANKN